MRHIEGALFGIADLRIIEIGKRYKRAPPHSACNDTFAHHTDDVMDIDVTEAPALTVEHDLTGECEQSAKRFRTRSFTATDLQSAP